MDNDLMARRLRPPSEPVQPSAPQQSAPQEPDPQPPMPEQPQAAPAQDEVQSVQAPPKRRRRAPKPTPDQSAPPEPLWLPTPTDPPPWQAAQTDPPPWQAAQTDRPPWQAPETDPPQSPRATVIWPPVAQASAEIGEPEQWSQPARDEVPWDRPADYAPVTDSANGDEAPWDRPASYGWGDAEPVDDRTPDMIEAFADADAPVAAAVVSAPVAAPSADEADVADPYDAYAPILGDLDVPRAWPPGNGYETVRNSPTVAAAASPPTEMWLPTGTWPQVDPAYAPPTPVTPTGFAEGGLGPTPPADLFGNGTFGWAAAVEPDADAQPETFALDQTATPAPVAPAPAPQAPYRVRIELTLVDEAQRVVGAAETAINVGPVDIGHAPAADDTDAETEHSMARHPAFEPRAETASEIYEVPALPAPSAPSVADSGWIEPVGFEPWPATTVDEPEDNGWAPAAQTPSQPAVASEAGPGPDPFAALAATPWTQPSTEKDPLANLPAAASPTGLAPALQPAAPPPPPPAPVHATPYAPAPAPAVAAFAEPITAAAAPAASVAVGAQNDLWFLSTEAAAAVNGEDDAAEGAEASRVIMALFTVGMAILVVALVLLFFFLMTSVFK